MSSKIDSRQEKTKMRYSKGKNNDYHTPLMEKKNLQNQAENNNKKFFTSSNFIYIIIIIIISIYIQKIIIQRKNKEISKLEMKVLNLNEIISLKDEEIHKLKEIIILRDKNINELESKKLQLKLEDLSDKNLDYKNKIMKNYEEIKDYKIKINQLEEENNILRKTVKEITEQNEKITDDKLTLENNVKSIDVKNEEIRNKDNIILNLTNENKKKEDEIKIFKENSDKSSKYQDEKSENFYDLIVKINSIYGLSQGWEVLMNENGKKNYYEYKNKIFTKIGVIGSENRGKSTILSDLSQIDLPTGYSIKTEGLSIKFPV